MGVVLGRLFEPRRDAKNTFLSAENCFFPRRNTENIFLSAEDAEGRGELQNCFFIHEGPRRDTKDTFFVRGELLFPRRDTENTFFSTSVLRVVDRWLAPFDQYCAEPQSFLVFAVPCPDFSESRRA